MMERVAITNNRVAIVSERKFKSDTLEVKTKKVSEGICEGHYASNGALMNIITHDFRGNFYLYDCLPDIPKKVSRANSPLKLKGRRI